MKGNEAAHPALQAPPAIPTVLALEATELRTWPTGSEPQVVDVREPWELELCSLPGARHIPLGELPGAAHTLDPARPTVLVCHHGVRSGAAARFLLGLGFCQVFNLTGGIDAWAESVDPEMRRY